MLISSGLGAAASCPRPVGGSLVTTTTPAGGGQLVSEADSVLFFVKLLVADRRVVANAAMPTADVVPTFEPRELRLIPLSDIARPPLMDITARPIQRLHHTCVNANDRFYGDSFVKPF